MRRIKESEFLELYKTAQKIHSGNNEPIPNLKKENIDKVNYILGVPFQSVFGKVLYSGFYEKAAILTYLMNKNHVLENGNKRMSCILMAYFYEINSKQFNFTDKELYDMSIFIAKTKTEDKDKTIKYIIKFLKSKK